MDPSRTFVTGIGAGTTYPDYKPAPFIVGQSHAGVDTVTVVDRGHLQLLRRVKVKIDTDRHLGPEAAAIRVGGEQVGNVTTARVWLAMLSLGGVRHLTGGSKKEAPSPARRCSRLCNGEAVELTIDGGHRVVVQAGKALTDRRRPGGAAHACGLRLGHHRHLRAPVARPCDEVIVLDDHITACSPNIRPQGAGHAPSRISRARPPLHAGPLFPGPPSPPRLGRHRHHRPAGGSIAKIDSRRRLARPAPADDLDHGRGRALVRAGRDADAPAGRHAS